MARKQRTRSIDIEIDKLTNSIELIATGEVFDTQVVGLNILHRPVIKKKDWRFNWRKELEQQDRKVYALVTVADPRVLQGLICLMDGGDHVLVHLVESARFNQGRNKAYAGVPANLFAFACRRSFQLGHDGVVAFISKTKLIAHYQKMLDAQILGGTRMSIGTPAALKLVTRYFPLP